jgi:kynureninase
MTDALFREEFPILERSTYLVSHSMGAAPNGARAALEAYWKEWAEDGPEAWERWLPLIGEVADGIGEIIGAPHGSIFLGSNVSVLQATLASCFDFRRGRHEVIYESLQFPSLTYVWQAWSRFGARPRVVPSADGRSIAAEEIIAAITERTALVVVSHAAYVSGALVDIAAIQRRCRETGALLCVDLYQTAGVYPLDVAALGLDLAVGGSHKWLCGGPGCGWIYVRPELLTQLHPAVTGWMAHARPFDFEPAPIEYAPSMYRFGQGTPTIPGYVVARAGHDLIRKAGVERIREHNVRLTAKLADGAAERGFIVPTPLDPASRTGWMGMDFEDAQTVYRGLIDERIFVDYRPRCGIRVSPHFYTTDEEIERFFEAVDRLRPSRAAQRGSKFVVKAAVRGKNRSGVK